MANPSDPANSLTPETSSSDAPSSGAVVSDASENLVSAQSTPGQPASEQPASLENSEATNAPLLDYSALARFLLAPLIDISDDLKITSEVTAQNKVSLQVSLGKADRGRAFGRGGRNIRAIRTILRAAGKNVGQTVSLEIVGDEGDGQGNRAKPKPRKAGEPRPSKPKPKPKSK